MAVSRRQGQSALDGKRCHPDIILRNWRPGGGQLRGDHAVLPGGVLIGDEHVRSGKKFLNLIEMLLGAIRLECPVIKFRQGGPRKVKLIVKGQSLRYRKRIAKMPDDDTAIEQDAIGGHPHPPDQLLRVRIVRRTRPHPRSCIRRWNEVQPSVHVGAWD